MKRFEEIKSSKFEHMNPTEMSSVKGGVCISCLKRARTVVIGTLDDGRCTIYTNNIKTKLFIVILLFIITFTAQGQSPVCAIKYSDMPTTTRLGIMYQRMTPTNEVSTLVQPIAKHPAMELNNPEALDSVRNLVVMRCESIGKDSLMTHYMC